MKKFILLVALTLGMLLSSNNNAYATNISGQIEVCGYNAYGNYECDWASSV
jgi:hypothetical protein